jgi:hypothetical protein
MAKKAAPPKTAPAGAKVKITNPKAPAIDMQAFGSLLAEHVFGVIGGPPTTGSARETGVKGGDRAPDDAAPDFDAD